MRGAPSKRWGAVTEAEIGAWQEFLLAKEAMRARSDLIVSLLHLSIALKLSIRPLLAQRTQSHC